MMRFFLRALMGVVSLGVLGVAGGLWLLDRYGQELPDYKRLAGYEPAVTTRVHAGDGRLLAEYARERRVFVPFEAIPRVVWQAFLSAEDKTFFEHRGLDLPGIAAAAFTNFQNMGQDRRPVGASTITQQVAKNLLLTNEVSIERKVKEVLLSVRIEQALTKQRILELYLNEIFLGFRSYGVGAAALNYFGKALDELTVAEAAYLAALPKAPNNYHPINRLEAAVARRNWVIGRMVEDGYVEAADGAAAVKEPLTVRRRDQAELPVADYFAEEVRRELLRLLPEMVPELASAADAETRLYEGGLSVRATMDPRLQEIASRALRMGLMGYDRKRGWRGPVAKLPGIDDWPKKLDKLVPPPGGEGWRLAVVIDTGGKAGARIGLVDRPAGAAPTSDPVAATGFIPLSELTWARLIREGGRLGPPIRRPADAVQVGDVIMVEALSSGAAGGGAGGGGAGGDAAYGLRQIPEVQGGMAAVDPHTGRVLALVGGFSPAVSSFNRATQAMRQPGSSFKPFVYLTALENGYTPSSLVMDAPFEYHPGGGQAVWRPENYAHDYLGPTTLRVGLEKSRNLMTVRLALSVGMDKVKATVERFGVVDSLDPVLAMSLGASETTVLRMTTAYAMFVNGGRRIEPTVIDRVQDRTGKTIYAHDRRVCPECRVIGGVGGQEAGTGGWQPGLRPPQLADDHPQIADPRVCYQIVSMLEGVATRGTAAKLAALKQAVAGKTGTTNDAKDAWFVGFTPNLAVGLYVGFDHPQPLGGHETGGSLAAPIFQQVIGDALAGVPPKPFRQPPGIRLVRVNHDNGRTAQAGDRLQIWEAFLPDTEPEVAGQAVLDGSGNTAYGNIFGAGGGGVPATTLGTGGLY